MYIHVNVDWTLTLAPVQQDLTKNKMLPSKGRDTILGVCSVLSTDKQAGEGEEEIGRWEGGGRKTVGLDQICFSFLLKFFTHFASYCTHFAFFYHTYFASRQESHS